MFVDIWESLSQPLIAMQVNDLNSGQAWKGNLGIHAYLGWGVGFGFFVYLFVFISMLKYYYDAVFIK